ncbi:MAG: surface lipoprotein assembly modifier [Poseidonibacter sp.]|uniref:tetratricopeptide repeat protein n=1 Tax=Poseidonibacter sp. TaxID=2321188 RepID=UPI00359E6211
MKIINKNSAFVCKSLLLLSLAQSFTYAQDTISSSGILKNNNYENSLLAYKNKDFLSAYNGFKEYLQNNDFSKEVTFMFARSAFEIGKYDDALISYKRILNIQENNLRVKLELAQTYFKLKEYDKSETIFKEVLSNEIPKQVRENIELSLASLKTKNKKSFIKSTFIFGLGYDSNINNNSDINKFTISSGTFPFNNQQDSDEIINLALSLNHTYVLNKSLFMENKFLAYTQHYTTFSEKDIDLIALGSALSYQKNNNKFSLGLDFNHINLDSKSYLNNFSLTPTLQTIINKKLMYEGYFKISKKDFTQSLYQAKDSKVYELSNKFIFSSQNYGTSSISFLLGTEKKDKGLRTDVDQNFANIKLDNKYPLNKTMLLTNLIEVSKNLYKQKDVDFLTKRKDRSYTISSGIIKSINKNLALGLSANYTDTNSNQKIYEYDKYSLRTNLYYSF